MKKYLKNNISLILSFILPIFIIIGVLLITKIYPFGDKILLAFDGYNQYPGFLNGLFENIKNNQSIFYSFKGFLGLNTYANFVYYSLNISNLFYFLFNNIINFYTFIIVLKFGLASLTMCIFLNYIKKNKYNFIFSICYGLSAYNLLYYFNYMWFDSVILFPLVIYGIEKIFKENKYIPYFIFLALSIICNFYIGYMICIFSVIYFIYKCINDKFSKTILKKYIITSLLAGLITSVFLLPTILELLQGKGTLFGNYSFFKFDLDFINVFYKLTYGSFINGDLEYGNPNVYVSLFVYIGFIMYFFNTNIKLKERLTSLGIFLFFLLSMSFNLLDFFWQMFQMPIWYPVRYAFIFDFFIILLAFRNLINFKEFKIKYLLLIIVSIIILSIIGFYTAGNLRDVINVKTKYIYLFLSILFVIYYAFIINSKLSKKIILCLLLFELSLNGFISFRDTTNRKSYVDFIQKYNINKNALDNINFEHFDRITTYKKTIKNNGLLHNYNDINLFSSIRNAKTVEILDKLFETTTIDDCNVNYTFNNPLTNALLNIKYYITNEDIDYYDLIDNSDEINIYKNNDAPGIAFITNSNVLDLKLTDKYVDNINKLIKTINKDDKNILEELIPSEKSISCGDISCIINGQIPYIKYEYTAKDKEFLSISNKQSNTDEIIYNIDINGKVIKNNDSVILLNKGDSVKIYIEVSNNAKDYNYNAYIINYDGYLNLINNINKEKVQIINYKNDANFKLKVNSNTNDQILFTTIPSEKGFHLKLNGKDYKYEKIYDSLIGIKLNSGDNIIEFKYEVPGLKSGSIITLLSLGISIFYFKKKKISK